MLRCARGVTHSESVTRVPEHRSSPNLPDPCMTHALSLDFWGTLAMFNPAYTAARTSLLAELSGLPEAEAAARYKAVKRQLDADAERFGTAVTPTVACERLLAVLHPVRPTASDELRQNLEALARRSQPILTADTASALHRAADAGLVLCLASNTNFLAGALMTELFAGLPLHARVYSDEVGVSKPHPNLFRAVLEDIRRHRPDTTPEQVTHVGDHPVCDQSGAERAGFQAVLVRSPAETVGAIDRLIARRGDAR